jgi:hypothetical protein
MRRYSAILFLLLTIIQGAAVAQAPTGIRGTIRLDSGRPLVKAIPWTIADSSFRDARTDSLGRFRLSVKPGTYALEVVCPIAPFSGVVPPVALRRTVVVADGEEADVSATIAATACDPISPRTVRVHWRGWYSAGFEESSFRPCETDTLAREMRAYGHPFGRHAWVTVSSTAWRRSRLDGVPSNPRIGGVAGFVEWSGSLRGPAASGHMGGANYDLTVDSIFSVAATGACD